MALQTGDEFIIRRGENRYRATLTRLAEFMEIALDFVGQSQVQTLSNKTIVKRVVAAATTSGAIEPTAQTADVYVIAGLTDAVSILEPSGTPTHGQQLILRIKDNGSSRALTWAGAYRPIGGTLPITTTTSKTLYVGCIYNATDDAWDVVAISQEV